jgi:hypothetical protein
MNIHHTDAVRLCTNPLLNRAGNDRPVMGIDPERGEQICGTEVARPGFEGVRDAKGARIERVGLVRRTHSEAGGK